MMVRYPRKRYAYEKSRFLRRRKGWSYDEIKKELGVAKSTVSLWCQDIVLSPIHRARIERKRRENPHLGGIANHIKREKEIRSIVANAAKEITAMDLDAFRIAGATLYWAEGAKTEGASLSNSDPKIIEFIIRWLNSVFNIHPRNLAASLHIHYGDDDKRIKRYWSSLTNIPLTNFGKSFIKPKGTGHRTHILPNGIIRIRIKGRGSEDLRHRILAWTEKIYILSKRYQSHP